MTDMNDLFPIEQRRELLTLEETAARLSITADTLRRWMKAGKFPKAVSMREERTVSYKVTRTVQRVRSDDLGAFLEARSRGRRAVDRTEAA